MLPKWTVCAGTGLSWCGRTASQPGHLDARTLSGHLVLGTGHTLELARGLCGIARVGPGRQSCARPGNSTAGLGVRFDFAQAAVPEAECSQCLTPSQSTLLNIYCTQGIMHLFKCIINVFKCVRLDHNAHQSLPVWPPVTSLSKIHLLAYYFIFLLLEKTAPGFIMAGQPVEANPGYLRYPVQVKAALACLFTKHFQLQEEA